MQSEGVSIAIVSTVITAVVATTIVVAAIVVVAVAVGAFGRPLLGLLVPNVEVVIFNGIVRCKSSGRDTPSATDAGGPLDG
jgi:Na+/citrate or Na+/malate symporter